jgi:hypothetical protein
VLEDLRVFRHVGFFCFGVVGKAKIAVAEVVDKAKRTVEKAGE